MKRLLSTIAAGLLIATAVQAETTQHDFGDAVTAEVYKVASGDNLWIYFEETDEEGQTESTVQHLTR